MQEEVDRLPEEIHCDTLADNSSGINNSGKHEIRMPKECQKHEALRKNLSLRA
jgi:hypothetical protein